MVTQKEQNKSWKNKLYFGDNLDILRDKIFNDSIDLIYLDPPFKSGRNYNIIFQPEAGKIKGASAQIQTFKDTWSWGSEAEKNYRGLIRGTITKEKPNQKVIDLIKAMRSYLGECSMMAYLSMMTPRLLEMKRVLKDSGTIYLHCDPTASHYLKLLMDAIFGVENFRNEIIWSYKDPSGKTTRFFRRKHDTILFYSKTNDYFFNADAVRVPYAKSTQEQITRGTISFGRKSKGHPLGKIREDVWEIPIINSQAKERTGYPTQKPEALLEVIIKVGSKEGSLVLDPFCGCGTTVAVAERLRRKWVGIDITYVAIDVISKRLKKSGIKENVDFEIDGEPKDVYSARKLAQKDPFQFQIWCISKLDAISSQTKSGDKGVDGIINFIDPSKSSKVGKGIIQVKGTENVNPSMIRDLKGTLKSQDASFGIFISFRKPTQGMINEATKEGYFTFLSREIPKIQILTVKELFKDPIPIKLPQTILPPYKRPKIEKELKEMQRSLLAKE